MTAAAGTASAARRLDLAPILKESLIAGLVAAVLALPLVGLQTADIGGGSLGIRTHFDWVIYGALAVAAGRFAMALLRAARERSAKERRARAVGGLAAVAARLSLPAALVGLAFAVSLPFLPFADRYVVDVATTVMIYVMLGWGLNVVVGLAGLLDLGYVAFYAVGAYSFALLAQNFGFTFWEALPIAGLCSATFGVVLGFPVLRLRGDYLAIVTLGFGEIIRIILMNWWQVTGGPNGIGSIPRPSFFGIPFAPSAAEGQTTFAEFWSKHFWEVGFSPEQRIVFLYFVILTLALLTNLFTLRLRRLPIGRAWEALREDEIACRALGINPTNTKLTAFAIGAMFGGFAGSFFATRQGFISPESFTFIESAIILAIVVLGGMGSQMGVVLAAVVLVTLPEFGRALAEWRMLIFGAAMVGIMVWRPRGLLAFRDPTIRLHRGEARGAG